MGQQWHETWVLQIAGRFAKRLQGLGTQLCLKKPTMPVGSESGTWLRKGFSSCCYCLGFGDLEVSQNYT